MPFVKQAPPEPKQHECETPTRMVKRGTPRHDTSQAIRYWSYEVPSGTIGDIWQCEVCGSYWILKWITTPPTYPYAAHRRVRRWVRAESFIDRRRVKRAIKDGVTPAK